MPQKGPHQHIGTMSCWSCSKEVPVKKTSGGTLSAPCSWCDYNHYAKPGTKHYESMLSDVKLNASAEEKKTAAPAAAAAAKPARSYGL